MIASLLLTARRKGETAICEATPRRLHHRSRERADEAGSRNRTDSPLASHACRGDCVPVTRDRNQGNDAAVQEIDLFDFIAGQMQELALADGDDLQMGLEQRIIPRLQCLASRGARGASADEEFIDASC